MLKASQAILTSSQIWANYPKSVFWFLSSYTYPKNLWTTKSWVWARTKLELPRSLLHVAFICQTPHSWQVKYPVFSPPTLKEEGRSSLRPRAADRSSSGFTLRTKSEAPTVASVFRPLNITILLHLLVFSLVHYNPTKGFFAFSLCWKALLLETWTVCCPFSFLSKVTSKRPFPHLPSKRRPSLFLQKNSVWYISTP